MKHVSPHGSVEVHPLTPDRFRDLEALFNTNAVTRDCWCMWFRMPTADFRAQSGEQKRAAMRKIVRTAGVPPGLLAYVDGKPAGWCAVAPRETYPRIERSNTVRPIDDRPAWSIVCFFIHSEARGRGVMKRLIDAAVQLAADNGARLVEAYPVDPGEGRVRPDEAYYGVVSAFAGAGFQEAARRHPRRPIMRKPLA